MRSPPDARTLADRLSQPTPLYAPGKGEPVLWLCGVCQRANPLEENARYCYTCAPYKRDPCPRCGDRVKMQSCYTHCDVCIYIVKAEAEEERLDAAPQVAEADYGDDPVFWGDRWYSNLEDFREAQWGDDLPFPARVWAARKVEVPELSVDDILDGVEENCGPFDDDFAIEWNGVAELREAVKAFNAAQTAHWWEEDARAVVLDPAINAQYTE